MPLGTGLLLRNGESGFFLGDVKWGRLDENGGFGVMTRLCNNEIESPILTIFTFDRSCKLLVVQKEHIRAFCENGRSISPREASHLLSLASYTSEWANIIVDGCKSPILEGNYISTLPQDSNILNALNVVKSSKDIPVPPTPASITRQKVIVDELLQELEDSPVTKDDDGEMVINALQYVSSLKDPAAFVSQVPKDEGESSTGDVYAWRMFQNVMKILQQFRALDGSNSTQLGNTVSSLSGDNELWLATVLQSPCMQRLTESVLQY